MLFFNLFYQFRRHTAHNCILRNIPCHNCPGCDHSTVSYADALCNDRSRSDPDPVADPDRGITVVPVIGIQVMINSRKDNIVADQCVITDIYSTLILQKSESGVRLCLVSRRLFLKAGSRTALSRSNVSASYTSIPASCSFVPGCTRLSAPSDSIFRYLSALSSIRSRLIFHSLKDFLIIDGIPQFCTFHQSCVFSRVLLTLSIL